MKVDLLHYAAPPVVGGVEAVLAQHARLMHAAGHRVRILAGRGEPIEPGIPFVQLPLVDSRHPRILEMKAALDVGQVPAEFADLVAELHDLLARATRGTQVLIAHNVCSLHKNLALTVALQRLHQGRPELRLVLWHHDLAWLSSRYLDELHSGEPWDLLRRDWPAAQQVVVSQLRQRQLAELIGVPLERVRVVPNGLDLGRFFKLEARSATLVEQLDLFSAAPLLLLPVRLTRRKNIELALRTLSALRKEYFPEARLLVTGPLGPHNPANAAYLQELFDLRQALGLASAAHFLAELSPDFLPDAVIFDLYRLADALFLPSREEGFGIPVLEAGLSGLPLFCSDIPTLRELAGEAGLYFSPDADPGQVAGLVFQRLHGDALYRMRLQVRQCYGWGQIYRQHIAPLLDDMKE